MSPSFFPPHHHTDAATPEEDFSPVRGTSVVLQAGYTTGDPLEMELTVPIRDDSLFEDTETFQIVLSSTSNGVVLGSPSVKTVHILDNDSKLELKDIFSSPKILLLFSLKFKGIIDKKGEV